MHAREKRTGQILEILANGTRAPILIHNNSDVISCNDAHALHIISPLTYNCYTTPLSVRNSSRIQYVTVPYIQAGRGCSVSLWVPPTWRVRLRSGSWSLGATWGW